MNDAALKAMIRYETAKGEVTELANRLSGEERGEMGSWMILSRSVALVCAGRPRTAGLVEGDSVLFSLATMSPCNHSAHNDL